MKKPQEICSGAAPFERFLDAPGTVSRTLKIKYVKSFFKKEDLFLSDILFVKRTIT